jgi:hypothetical protein
VVEGPVSVSGCTTKEQIYEDNANRSFLIYLDESKEQDKRIMDYQRKISARKINQEADNQAKELLQNFQRILEPIAIVNPFAELLNIPDEVLKPRRSNNHYLQFIEAITFYHQHQRIQKVDEETGEIFIETTLEDVEEANKLMKIILLRKSDELSGACRDYLEAVKSYLEQENKKEFTNQEIRRAFKVNPSNQKRYNLSLLSNFYVKKVKGKKGTAYNYQIVSYKEFQELKNHVSNVLDENLKKLERFTGSPVVQNKNEPLKKKRISKVKDKSTEESKKVS